MVMTKNGYSRVVHVFDQRNNNYITTGGEMIMTGEEWRYRCFGVNRNKQHNLKNRKFAIEIVNFNR